MTNNCVSLISALFFFWRITTKLRWVVAFNPSAAKEIFALIIFVCNFVPCDAILCTSGRAASYHYYFLIDVDLFSLSRLFFLLLSTRRNRNERRGALLIKIAISFLHSDQNNVHSTHNGPLCSISLIFGFNLYFFMQRSVAVFVSPFRDTYWSCRNKKLHY